MFFLIPANFFCSRFSVRFFAFKLIKILFINLRRFRDRRAAAPRSPELWPTLSNSRLLTALTWLWGKLTSIRLTLFLLLALALLAIIGTVRFEGIYYSPVFLGPLALLGLNICACLVEGLPRAIRRVRQPFGAEAALALPERARFSYPGIASPHPWVEQTLRQELGRPRKVTLADKDVYLYERGRWRPLGPYLIHLALLLILAGGLLGKYWGIEGRLLLLEGEKAGAFDLDRGRRQPLGFEVRLDHFQVRYYPGTQTPQEFRSDLTFLGPEEPPKAAICRVNEPATFGSFKFYQSSYGHALQFQVTQGESSRVIDLVQGRVMEVPGGHARVKLLTFQENLVMPGGGPPRFLGPAAQLAYQVEGRLPQVFWVLKNYPQFVERQPGPHRFTLLAETPQFFSVFQVKYDPGVPWVYAGFILLLPGFFLAFFHPAQRWALVLQQRGEMGVWEGRLLGASPRAREAFLLRTARLAERLKQREVQ